MHRLHRGCAGAGFAGPDALRGDVPPQTGPSMASTCTSVGRRSSLSGLLRSAEAQAGAEAKLIEPRLVVRVGGAKELLRGGEADAHQDEQGFDAVAPGQLLTLLAAARCVVDRYLV